MSALSVPAFRFDRATHTYFDACGNKRPHITGMLQQAGLVDESWFTEESCERGTAVHQLTADYDLDALDPNECDSIYRGWLLAYVEASRRLRPSWRHVEVPRMHPTERWGGRPDRDGLAFSLPFTVLEVKSGTPDPSHQVQTALQTLLLQAQEPSPPVERWQRLALYVKGNGRFKLEEHRGAARDFAKAREIIRKCCS